MVLYLLEDQRKRYAARENILPGFLRAQGGRVGGKARVFRFYNNKQTNKERRHLKNKYNPVVGSLMQQAKSDCPDPVQIVAPKTWKSGSAVA